MMPAMQYRERRPRRIAWLRRFLISLLLAFSLTQSNLTTHGTVERVRRFTRPFEFEFAGWTLDAVGLKLTASSLSATAYLPEAERHALVLRYAAGIDRRQQLLAEITERYADPLTGDGPSAAAPLQAELSRLEADLLRWQPTVEAILQEQVAIILEELGLDVAGAAVPPVAFHFSDLPMAVIVSPREVIRQDANVQVEPSLPLEEQVRLERSIEQAYAVSALVVLIGGIGTYPTMVAESGAVPWVAEVVAHEWTHNYLTLRPLGLSYDISPALRTMNETAASLMGKEIGRRLIERYYPELAPPPSSGQPEAPPVPAAAPSFDFRREMHETRLAVDRLLAEGKIKEAEAYMEQRRQMFWQNGFHDLRRLNQAYFAFHGAYADEPGGAAGEDPVGAAVRQLWSASRTPADFLRRIAWMSSFEALQEALREG
jgi:hypothetical protein